MRGHLRLTAGAGALVVLAGMLVVLTPSAASAEPIEALYANGIDRYAAYDGADSCSPTDKPGAVVLKNLVLATYPGTTGAISRACSGGTSEHEEGRAFDWMVSAGSQGDIADDLLDWLLADDAYGNDDAMARRFGVMYIIWNHRMWRAYDADQGWQDYHGSNPHTDHVHISMSWDGALTSTSWFTGVDAGMRLDQARFAAAWHKRSRLDILRRGSSGGLERRAWAGAWGPWEDVGGGALTSGPAAVWAGRTLWVFARGAGGTLQSRRWRAASGWEPWEVSDVEIVAAPGVASRGRRVDLAVLGTDQSVEHRSWRPKRGWSAWEDLGGIVTAPPAVVWRSHDRLDVFARGATGKLYVTSRLSGTWNAWVDLGGFQTAGPAATSLTPGRADVFVRTTAGTVAYRYDIGSGWTSAVDLGGRHVSGPSASRVGGNRMDLFSRTRTGGLSQNYYFAESGWSGWGLR